MKGKKTLSVDLMVKVPLKQVFEYTSQSKVAVCLLLILQYSFNLRLVGLPVLPRLYGSIFHSKSRTRKTRFIWNRFRQMLIAFLPWEGKVKH